MRRYPRVQAVLVLHNHQTQTEVCNDPTVHSVDSK